MTHRNFEDILAVIYNRIPRTFRESVSHIAEPGYLFLKRWYVIFTQFQLPVYILHGKAKQGENVLAIALFGKEVTANYLAKLLFSANPRMLKLKKAFIWQVTSKINEDLIDCNLVFIDIDEIFHGFLVQRGFILLPQVTLFMIDLSKSIPETLGLKKSTSLSRNLMKMKRLGYHYELTDDPTRFKDFYFNMYLPHQTVRHQERFTKVGYHQMKRMFEKGLLLLVKRGAECVAGNVIVLNKSWARYYANGIKDGEVTYLKEGALTASYYYTILWAKDNGFRWLDFGHCRPFHKNGIFRYKKKWGMEIRKSKRSRLLLGLRVFKVNRAVEQFMTEEPFVFLHNGKLNTFCLAGQEAPVDKRKLDSLIRSFKIPGIDEVLILSQSGFTEEAKQYADFSTGPRICLANMHLKDFCRDFAQSFREASSRRQTTI